MIDAVQVPRLICQTCLRLPTFDVVIWFNDEYRLPFRLP